MTIKNRELQDRLEKFVKDCIDLVNLLPKTISNLRIFPQLIDSSTGSGANYHEACEGESSKDFIHKMKISKKELRETNYWLRILENTNELHKQETSRLVTESDELVKIFSSIVSKFTV